LSGSKKKYAFVVTLALALLVMAVFALASASDPHAATEAVSATMEEGATPHAWWFWPLVLLILSFFLGVFAGYSMCPS
jgi:uncharacterized BrkB/YihY/UPF0761 family membrane protein